MVDSIKELRAALADLRDSVEQKFSGLREVIDDQTSQLRLRIDEAGTKNAEQDVGIAHIESTIRAARWIGTSTVIVCSILGALGVYKLISNAEEIQKGLPIIKAAALSTQDSLVDRLEIEFSQLSSLDEFGRHPDLVARINSISDEIREVGKNVNEQNRSSYFLMGKALSYYIDKDCTNVLTTLDSIKEGDRIRFTYTYMRAACLLRTNSKAEAQKWLAKAAAIKADKRATMVRNVQALEKLYLARKTNRSKLGTDVVTEYRSIIKDDPSFYPAYINIACAFAILKQYDDVTFVLRQARWIHNADEVIASIRNDFAQPSDHFLEGYVRDYLKVSVRSTDPEWARSISAALKF